MIGTFYRAPSPEAGHYIEIGMEVNPETVVCIIEAMKVMNEIKAEAKGVITQVMVENAKPVDVRPAIVQNPSHMRTPARPRAMARSHPLDQSESLLH